MGDEQAEATAELFRLKQLTSLHTVLPRDLDRQLAELEFLIFKFKNSFYEGDQEFVKPYVVDGVDDAWQVEVLKCVEEINDFRFFQ